MLEKFGIYELRTIRIKNMPQNSNKALLIIFSLQNIVVIFIIFEWKTCLKEYKA